MAKLKRLPSQAIIDGFKGTIDYYVHMGVPCARTWPSSPGHNRATAVRQQWPIFTYATRAWKHLDPELQSAYRHSAVGTSMSGYELFIRSYITGYLKEVEELVVE